MQKLLAVIVLSALLLSSLPSPTFAQSADQTSLQQMASLISALQSIFNALKIKVQALKGGGAVQTAQAQTTSINVVQMNSGMNQSTQLSVTSTGTALAGEYMIVVTRMTHASATVTGVTDNQGNIYSRVLGPVRGSPDNASFYIYMAPITTGGSITVTTTWSNSANMNSSLYRVSSSGSLIVGQMNNASGNSTTPNPGSVTTTNANALLIAATTNNGGESTAAANWTLNNVVNSNWYDADQYRVVSSAGTYSGQFGATPGGSWTAVVAAFEGQGGTPPPSDTTPPNVSITAPASGSTVSGSSVTVLANASDNIGVVGVQFKLDGVNLGSEDTTSPYSITWNSTTASNGSHTLSATARDAAGNQTTSSGVTITVNNTTSDTQAPSVPTGLTATAVSGSQINLYWTASTDNVGVTGYRIYRGGVQITTITGTSYSDTGLSPSTSYSYTVAAYDAAGNVSAQSASASASTQAGGGAGIPSAIGWYQIPNTQLRPVCAVNNGFPQVAGITGCWGIVSAWNSGTFDTLRNRLVIWGGGHADYIGNELYSFDLDTLQMTRLTDPGLPPVTSGVSETLAGGTQPNSRHTYDSLVYLPVVDRLFAFGGSLSWDGGASRGTWTFNFANNTWQNMNPTGQLPRGDYGIVTGYDPNTQKVFLHDGVDLYTYAYSTNSYQKLTTNSSGIDYHMTGVIDPVRRKFVILGGGQAWIYDISGSTYTRQTLSTAGGSAIINSIYPGLAYDPVSDRIVAWNGGDTVYSLNLDTNTWTSVTYAGGPGAQTGNGTYERWSYSPALNLFVLVNSVDQNAYTFRLSSGGTPPPTDTTAPTASVTSPTGGTTVVNTVTISANASDNVGVTNVEFLVDGVVKGSDSSSPYSYSWDTTNGGTHPCNGAHTHTLVTRAYDAAGNVGSSSGVAVNMNNPSYCTTPPPTGGQVTSFQLTSPTSGTLPFTIGLGFKKGDVIGTPALNIPDQQVIVKKRWNDGSVKHVIASGQTALTANTPRTIGVLNAGSSSGTDLTAASIQAANPQASVQLGSIGTVNLSSLLATPFRTWISGSEMVEAHYRSNVGSDPTLQVWFYVRLYKNGRMWVRAIVENGYLDVTTSNKSYVPTVTIGGATVYNNGGASLTHYAQTRWTQEGWIGGDPQITPKHDTTYLIDSKLVPNYAKRNPNASAFSSLTQTYVPMNNGDHEAGMGAAGFQQGIGLLPLWDALYSTSGDARAYRSSLANSSAMNSYPIVWRSSVSKLVARPSDFPTYAIEGGTYNYTAGAYTWEMNHEPSEGYLAYLISGDYWHYETMLMHASLNYLALNSSRGNGVNRILTAETRGTAWNIRTLAQAVAIAPEGDAVVLDHQTLLANNIAHWKTVKDGLGGVGIGYLYEYGFAYGTGLVAPWQQHFFIQSLGMGWDLEPLANMSAWQEVRDWMYRASVGIAGDANGYCFNYASNYNIKISNGGDSSPSSWYPDWRTVYTATNGSLPCGNTLQGSSGGAPSLAATGYWGNFLPALAYAVDHGAVGASAAWARLTGASNWNVIDQSGFDDIPMWGIYPRTGQTPPPTTLVGDLNNDRTVNALDWSIMNGAWDTASQPSDINTDGIVNSIDFSLLNANWGRSI